MKPRAGKEIATLWVDGHLHCALVQYKRPPRLIVVVRTGGGHPLVFEQCEDREAAAECAARLRRLFGRVDQPAAVTS
jgi:hypothetical protein